MQVFVDAFRGKVFGVLAGLAAKGCQARKHTKNLASCENEQRYRL